MDNYDAEFMHYAVRRDADGQLHWFFTACGMAEPVHGGDVPAVVWRRLVSAITQPDVDHG